jgi:hypothetical protein
MRLFEHVNMLRRLVFKCYNSLVELYIYIYIHLFIFAYVITYREFLLLKYTRVPCRPSRSISSPNCAEANHSPQSGKSSRGVGGVGGAGISTSDSGPGTGMRSLSACSSKRKLL